MSKINYKVYTSCLGAELEYGMAEFFLGEVLWQCLLFWPSGKHFEPAVKNYSIRIIVYWVLLKCTVFRLFSAQRRRFHCWKEQCYRSLVSLLCSSHYLPSSSPSYLIFYLLCSSAEDVSGVLTGAGSKTSKKVHSVPDHLIIFGIFWSALLLTRM